MIYRVVQPYGSRRGQMDRAEPAGTLDAAFAAIDALRAKMVKTDAIELNVVNELGERIVKRPTH